MPVSGLVPREDLKKAPSRVGWLVGWLDELPSLKLTFSNLKMDGWKMIVSF